MATIPKWNPRAPLSGAEKILMKRLGRVRKLFAFLREHRLELFDDVFQEELAKMYRETGAGRTAVPPAMLAMATLLQAYVGASDAEAVELTVVDLRWQMVLDCLGAQESAFSQGSLHDFRHRMISHDMDRRLLERTVGLARRTQGFDAKRLPKSLRVGMDSMPLEGSGRVEDTFNLLGHAARNVVTCAARLLGLDNETICRRAGVEVLLASSVKAGLDVTWHDREDKVEALRKLVEQLDSLCKWLEKQHPAAVDKPPLSEQLDVLRQLMAQDLEPDPDGSGKRIRRGVASDRRVSVTDGEMRHGRKSKSKLFNGFKRHIAADIDSCLILACALTPANHSDAETAATLRDDLKRQGFDIGELFIDLGYLSSPVVNDVVAEGGEVVCKPRPLSNRGRSLTKADFQMDLRARTITCPTGQVQSFRFGDTVHFDPALCAKCALRTSCTTSPEGRSVHIALDERLQNRLRKAAATRTGRRRLRERVRIEHHLAHVRQRQGRRARYRGGRANLFDLYRACAIQNLETMHRKCAA